MDEVVVDEVVVVGNPFASLMVPPPVRLPVTTSSTVVVDGKVLPKGRRLTNEELARLADAEDAEDVALVKDRLRVARRAHDRARFQRAKAKPEVMDKRRAWEAANKDKRAAYQEQWEARNRERRRVYRTEWARRKRLLDAAFAAKDRDRAREFARKNAERRRLKRAAMTPEQRAADAARKRRYRQENRDRINARKREWRARKMAEAARDGGAV